MSYSPTLPFSAAKDSNSAQSLTSASTNMYVPVEFSTTIGGDALTATGTTWTARVDGVVEFTFSCTVSSLLNPSYDPENLFIFAGYKKNSDSEVDVVYLTPYVWANINGSNITQDVLVSVPISVSAGDTLKAVVQLSVTDGADFDFGNRFFRVKYINIKP